MKNSESEIPEEHDMEGSKEGEAPLEAEADTNSDQVSEDEEGKKEEADIEESEKESFLKSDNDDHG